MELFLNYRNAPTLEVYLQCNYDEEDYRAEVQRLENTKKQYGSTIRTLIRDEEGRYPYPAYIAVDGLWHSYEYALLSGEGQITYIYTAYMYSDDLKKLDKMYLPTDYDEKQDKPESEKHNCIYLEKEDKMDGEVIGWSHDYTRDELVDVLEYHTVHVGYNLFGVCTSLDEQDRKIIRYCYDWHYESLQDSYDGLPKETQYKELVGCEFKSVSLSLDGTKAIVTYYDEAGEEKTMEYDAPFPS